MATKSSFRAQFLSGFGANLYSNVVTTITQLVTIPAMIYYWGADLYGSWIALSALPMYFSLADLGMAQVTGNEMTMAIARDDRAHAERVNQVSWFMIGGISCAIIPLAALVALCVPLADLLNIVPSQASNVGSTFILLAVSAALSVAFGITSGGLKSVRLYWVGVTANATFRLISFGSLILVAANGGTLLAAAAARLAVQILILLPVSIFFYRHQRWLLPKGEMPDWSLLRRLLGPSLSYMLFYLNDLIRIQGVSILVAAALGPTSVVIVQSVRTLARAGRMMSEIAIRALQPIFGQMIGSGNHAQSQKAFRMLLLGNSAGAAVYALSMTILGPTFLVYWTRGVVTGYEKLLYLMIIGVVIEILWATLQTPFTATNRHSTFAVWLIASSTASLGLCAYLMGGIGVDAAGWSLVAANFSVLTFTLWRILRLGI